MTINLIINYEESGKRLMRLKLIISFKGYLGSFTTYNIECY